CVNANECRKSATLSELAREPGVETAHDGLDGTRCAAGLRVTPHGRTVHPSDDDTTRQNPTTKECHDMRSISFVALVASFSLCSTVAQAQDGNQDGNNDGTTHLSAHLQPSHEVPVVSSPADARFSAVISADGTEITYEMTFSGLQAPITQSHIHIGQPNVNGGIVLWLCGTTTNPGPTGTQTCPQEGTITGTLHANDVQMVSMQGIPAGGFDRVVAEIRAGLAYANIHSSQSPGGELR